MAAMEPVPNRPSLSSPTMPEQRSPSAPTSKKHRRSLVDIMTLGLVADASRKKPWGLEWRSSSWFITTVVTLGVATDLLTHTIVVPIAPFRLEALGYSNVSSLTSWLLVAYSGGLAVLTPFIGFFFHRFPWRRGPLLFSIVIMQGALVFFMLVTPYWGMILSRVILGASSAIVWSVGFVLIVENVREENIGRQLGFATSGVSIGATIGPPIGGALYDSMGWHAPFIFCIIICAVDFVGRMLVVEQKDARLWRETAVAPQSTPSPEATEKGLQKFDGQPKPAVQEKQLSPLAVIAKLGRAPRGLAAIAVIGAYSLVIGLQEPTITVHTKTVWNKDSQFVGLLYLAAALPTFFVGPIAGELADRYGSEFVIVPGLLLSLPWLPLLILDKNLPAFVVFFAISTVFLSIAAAPIGLELAMTAKSQEGISEIHQFAAMNLTFAIFAMLGPIIGGQLYDYVDGGFTVVCWLMFGIMLVPIIPTFCFTGRRPLLNRMLKRRAAVTVDDKPAEPAAEQGITEDTRACAE